MSSVPHDQQLEHAPLAASEPDDGWVVRAACYVSVALAAFICCALWARPWMVTPGGIAPEMGDMVWTQAMFDLQATHGVFGVDPHIAFPDGLSAWSHPQLGLFVGGLAWIIGGPLDIPSAQAIMWVTAAVAGLCAAGILFFLRGVVGGRWRVLACVLAFSLAASPFVLMKSMHLSVAAFLLVPITLGVCVRWSASSRGSRLVLAILLAATAVVSPLWWIVVCGLIIAPVLLAVVVRKRWSDVQGLLVALLALGFGGAVQTAIAMQHQIEGLPPTRSAWDSNIYGGHLVDLFTASPFLNTHVPVLRELMAGASLEFSLVGMVGGLSAILTLLVVLSVPRDTSVRAGSSTAVLGGLSVSAVLLFVLGGLGNLQAALAVLIGGSSPARGWSRLSIILAILGAAWFLVLLCRLVCARPLTSVWKVTVVVCGFCLAASVLDIRAVPHPVFAAPESFSEHGPVQFLKGNVGPCPVAQLPQDGMPVVRVFDGTGSDVVAYYYRGLVPYLMAPEFFWTVGSWAPDTPAGLTLLPVEAGTADIEGLRSQGFCAVLYDRELAKTARNRDIALEGRDLSGMGPAQFSNERFSVYLLDAGD